VPAVLDIGFTELATGGPNPLLEYVATISILSETCRIRLTCFVTALSSFMDSKVIPRRPGLGPRRTPHKSCIGLKIFCHSRRPTHGFSCMVTTAKYHASSKAQQTKILFLAIRGLSFMIWVLLGNNVYVHFIVARHCKDAF
jgi:hypothetical protein